MHCPRIDRRTLLLWLGAASSGAVPTLTRAANAHRRFTLSPDDLALFNSCRSYILTSQLADGAVVAVAYPNAGQPALIEPYFANLACLGLLSAYSYAPDQASLPFVSRWLSWYADHQAEDGSIQVFDGVRGKNGLQTGTTQVRPDSLDSYAATYLSLVGAYTRLVGKHPKPKIIAAATRCLSVLARCRDENSFSWNFEPHNPPDGVVPGQYLVDNIEVYQGLAAAQPFFTAAGKAKIASNIRKLVTTLTNRMHAFWYSEQAYFVCLFGDKAAMVPWGQQPASVECLATVSALAFLTNTSAATRTHLWTKLLDRHGTDLANALAAATYVNEEPTVERVYLAALKAGSADDQATYLAELRTRAGDLLERIQSLSAPPNDGHGYPYVHRFGMIMQALLAQSGKFPAELPNVPLRPATAP